MFLSTQKTSRNFENILTILLQMSHPQKYLIGKDYCFNIMISLLTTLKCSS